MDDVLHVVHQEDVEALPPPLLEELNRLVHPVETIGLARRAVMGRNHLVHVADPPGDVVDLRLGVVLIRTDEDVVVVGWVVEGLEVELQHLLDDLRLVPGRHHHGDALGGLSFSCSTVMSCSP